jgi:quinol monooxygenase YgiN
VHGRLSACIVIAEFELLPARLGDFLTLARGFAGECLSQEPGCRQFDVVVLEGTPSGVLFYEAYDDLAAVEAHGRAAHTWPCSRPRSRAWWLASILCARGGARGHEGGCRLFQCRSADALKHDLPAPALANAAGSAMRSLRRQVLANADIRRNSRLPH